MEKTWQHSIVKFIMSTNQLDSKSTSGHRQRLKERFINSPIGSLPDYELLELMLFSVFPRRDTKPLAKRLIKHFGGIKEVFFADATELTTVEGVSVSVINALRLLEDFFSRLYKPASNSKETILNNWNSVLGYCTLTMGFKKQEFLRILYLDRKNRLISDNLMQQGTLDKVAIYPREIVKECITKSASAVIMIHNHPSGEAKPSADDISLTEKVSMALNTVGAVLHDHVIVAQDKHYSFRANGLLGKL